MRGLLLSSREAEGRPGRGHPTCILIPEGGRPAYIHERRAPAGRGARGGLRGSSGGHGPWAPAPILRPARAGSGAHGGELSPTCARSARRVHSARASPRSGSWRRWPGTVAPTRVSFCAAFRRSSSDLVPASPPRIAPRGAPTRSCSSRTGAESSPDQAAGRLGCPRRVGGRRDARSAAGVRATGPEAGVGALAPASPAAAASRRARSPPSSAAGVWEASPWRPALPGVGRPPAPPPPSRPRPTCQSPAQPPPHLRRRLPSSSPVPLRWTFHLRFLLSFILPFNSFLLNWPPLAFLPADSLFLRLLKNQNQSVFSLEFEGRASLA